SGGNQALYIQCNKFINLKEGITIKNSTLQNHTFGLDPNNQFTNILNYDIANYGSVPFAYNVNLSTPWTNPSTFYGTVFTSFVSSNECQITSPPRRSPSNDENIEKKESNLSVYPNPTNGSVKILLTDFEEKAQIYLYETSGKLIYTSEVLEENFTLDLSNYENGIYQLIISSGEQILRRKILLNK
ncbi:MAG: T9SS type A sorting domain-containing protein, partial [Flavobacteriales bacterium]|nr:T9SS type A sorting domain-containing protein [Flavobacteriales bacterium]